MKIIALSSVFTSLAVVGRVMLVVIPNVSPTVPLTILGGFLGGPVAGLLIGFLSMFISDMFIGVGPHTLVTAPMMGLVGLLSGLLIRRMRDKTLIFITAFLLTLVYDLSTSIITMGMFGVPPYIAVLNLFLPVFLGGIPYPMGPIHEFSSAFILVSLYEVLSSYSLWSVLGYER